MNIKGLIEKLKTDTPIVGEIPPNDSLGWAGQLGGDRSIVEGDPDRQELCWEQFDTEGDSENFGVWINRAHLAMLNLTHGYWILTEYKDPDRYNRCVAAACQTFPEGYVARKPARGGGWTYFRQDRRQFLVPVEGREYDLTPPEPSKNL